VIHGKRYRPMDADEMAAHLKVPGEERSAFDEAIESLKLGGELVEIKKRRLVDPARADLVVGKLLCNPRGSAIRAGSALSRRCGRRTARTSTCRGRI